MRIYVDGEIPECCNDCEFGYFYDCQYCSLRPDLAREDIWVEKEKYCPLHSLADYTKQVRKEVLSELRNMLGDRAELIDFGNGCAEFMFTTYDLQECSKEILDQIEQGEIKGE